MLTKNKSSEQVYYLILLNANIHVMLFLSSCLPASRSVVDKDVKSRWYWICGIGGQRFGIDVEV